MMDCTLILWANKSLSFHKIATVLCFVLTRKVAKTAMDQKGTFIYVIYVSKEFMNHFESTCMKKNSRLRLLGVSRYWKPWFLILWAMNHMGSHNECQDHKTSGKLKDFEMCANEKQIQNPTGNASTVSLVALAYVTLHDLTTAWNTWAKIEEDCTLWQQCFYCTWKTFCSYRNTMFYYWKHRLNIFFITPQHVSIKLVSLWIIQL